MQNEIFVALVAALVNLILSILVPCALNNHRNFLPSVRNLLENNRRALLTSSGLVFLTVYVALVISPRVQAEIPESVLRLVHLSK